MGLTITHIKLTSTPTKEYNYFEVDDWQLSCNVPLNNYEKYVQTIDDLDYSKSIAIVNNEQQYEELKKIKLFTLSKHLKVFVGDLNDSMQKQISKFITKQKLDRLKTIKTRNKIDDIEFKVISFGEPVKVKGVFYIDDIGYQYKGMDLKFYEIFSKYDLWGKKEDFELAYSCIDDEMEQEEVYELRENFKENFLGKYEFGRSLLTVSF